MPSEAFTLNLRSGPSFWAFARSLFGLRSVLVVRPQDGRRWVRGRFCSSRTGEHGIRRVDDIWGTHGELLPGVSRSQPRSDS